MTKLNLIYITTKDRAEARAIGKELVTSRLAACVNIIDGMNCMYWWQGEVRDEEEAVLIAKTKESLVGQLVEKVKSLHSYDCPCIVSIPISGGSRAYLDWIKDEAR